MTVLNQTNEGRVTKIVETVALLEKSARSNQATNEELWQLLDPAIQAISALVQAPGEDGQDEDPPTPNQPAPSQKEARWSLIHDLAREAPLHELTRAMAVFLNRIDEHLAEQRKD